MSGYAPTGSYPIASAPPDIGTDFPQLISATVAVAVSGFSRSTGKVISRVVSLTTTLPAKAIAFRRIVSPTITTVVRKQMSFRLPTITPSVATTIIKLTAKKVTTGLSLLPAMIRNTAKIVPVQSVLSVWSTVATLFITSRSKIHEPVDCVMAGDPPIKKTGRDFMVHAMKLKVKTVMSKSTLKRLE